MKKFLRWFVGRSVFYKRNVLVLFILLILLFGLVTITWIVSSQGIFQKSFSYQKAQEYQFSASGFAPHEAVNTWVSFLATGKSVALSKAATDAKGNVSFTVFSGVDWPKGGVQISARGEKSDHESSADFRSPVASYSVSGSTNAKGDGQKCDAGKGGTYEVVRGGPLGRGGHCVEFKCETACCNNSCQCSGTCGDSPEKQAALAAAAAQAAADAAKKKTGPTQQGTPPGVAPDPDTSAGAGDIAWGNCINRGGSVDQCSHEAGNAYNSKQGELIKRAKGDPDKLRELAEQDRMNGIETALKRAAACGGADGKALKDASNCIDPKGKPVSLTNDQLVVAMNAAYKAGCAKGDAGMACAVTIGKKVGVLPKQQPPPKTVSQGSPTTKPKKTTTANTNTGDTTNTGTTETTSTTGPTSTTTVKLNYPSLKDSQLNQAEAQASPKNPNGFSTYGETVNPTADKQSDTRFGTTTTTRTTIPTNTNSPALAYSQSVKYAQTKDDQLNAAEKQKNPSGTAGFFNGGSRTETATTKDQRISQAEDKVGVGNVNVAAPETKDEFNQNFLSSLINRVKSVVGIPTPPNTNPGTGTTNTNTQVTQRTNQFDQQAANEENQRRNQAYAQIQDYCDKHNSKDQQISSCIVSLKTDVNNGLDFNSTTGKTTLPANGFKDVVDAGADRQTDVHFPKTPTTVKPTAVNLPTQVPTSAVTNALTAQPTNTPSTIPTPTQVSEPSGLQKLFAWFFSSKPPIPTPTPTNTAIAQPTNVPMDTPTNVPTLVPSQSPSSEVGADTCFAVAQTGPNDFECQAVSSTTGEPCYGYVGRGACQLGIVERKVVGTLFGGFVSNIRQAIALKMSPEVPTSVQTSTNIPTKVPNLGVSGQVGSQALAPELVSENVVQKAVDVKDLGTTQNFSEVAGNFCDLKNRDLGIGAFGTYFKAQTASGTKLGSCLSYDPAVGNPAGKFFEIKNPNSEANSVAISEKVVDSAGNFKNVPYIRDANTSLEGVSDLFLQFLAGQHDGAAFSATLPDCSSKASAQTQASGECAKFRNNIKSWMNMIGAPADSYPGSCDGRSGPGWWSQQQCIEIANFVSIETNPQARLNRAGFNPFQIGEPVGSVSVRKEDLLTTSVQSLVGGTVVSAGVIGGSAGTAALIGGSSAVAPAVSVAAPALGGFYLGLAGSDIVSAESKRNDMMAIMGLPCRINGNSADVASFYCHDGEEKQALANKITQDMNGSAGAFKPADSKETQRIIEATNQATKCSSFNFNSCMGKKLPDYQKFDQLSGEYLRFLNGTDRRPDSVYNVNSQLDKAEVNLAIAGVGSAFGLGEFANVPILTPATRIVNSVVGKVLSPFTRALGSAADRIIPGAVSDGVGGFVASGGLVGAIRRDSVQELENVVPAATTEVVSSVGWRESLSSWWNKVNGAQETPVDSGLLLNAQKAMQSNGKAVVLANGDRVRGINPAGKMTNYGVVGENLMFVPDGDNKLEVVRDNAVIWFGDPVKTIVSERKTGLPVVKQPSVQAVGEVPGSYSIFDRLLNPEPKRIEQQVAVTMLTKESAGMLSEADIRIELKLEGYRKDSLDEGVGNVIDAIVKEKNVQASQRSAEFQKQVQQQAERVAQKITADLDNVVGRSNIGGQSLNDTTEAQQAVRQVVVQRFVDRWFANSEGSIYSDVWAATGDVDLAIATEIRIRDIREQFVQAQVGRVAVKSVSVKEDIDDYRNVVSVRSQDESVLSIKGRRTGRDEDTVIVLSTADLETINQGRNEGDEALVGRFILADGAGGEKAVAVNGSQLDGKDASVIVAGEFAKVNDVRNGLDGANDALVQFNARTQTGSVYSTVVAADLNVQKDGRMFVDWAALGNSRLDYYDPKTGGIVRINRDNSVMAQSAEQKKWNPSSGTELLGGKGLDAASKQTGSFPVEPRGVLVLSCDGGTVCLPVSNLLAQSEYKNNPEVIKEVGKVLSPEEVAQIAEQVSIGQITPEQASQQAIRLAYEKGSKDNISFVFQPIPDLPKPTETLVNQVEIRPEMKVPKIDVVLPPENWIDSISNSPLGQWLLDVQKILFKSKG